MHGSFVKPEAQGDAIHRADDGPVDSVVPHEEPVAVLVLQPLPEPAQETKQKNHETKGLGRQLF